MNFLATATVGAAAAKDQQITYDTPLVLNNDNPFDLFDIPQE